MTKQPSSSSLGLQGALPGLTKGGEERCGRTGSTRGPADVSYQSCQALLTLLLLPAGRGPCSPSISPAPGLQDTCGPTAGSTALHLRLCRELPGVLWLQLSATLQCSLPASPSAPKYILLAQYFTGAVGAQK